MVGNSLCGNPRLHLKNDASVAEVLADPKWTYVCKNRFSRWRLVGEQEPESPLVVPVTLRLLDQPVAQELECFERRSAWSREKPPPAPLEVLLGFRRREQPSLS